MRIFLWILFAFIVIGWAVAIIMGFRAPSAFEDDESPDSADDPGPKQGCSWRLYLMLALVFPFLYLIWTHEPIWSKMTGHQSIRYDGFWQVELVVLFVVMVALSLWSLSPYRTLIKQVAAISAFTALFMLIMTGWQMAFVPSTIDSSTGQPTVAAPHVPDCDNLDKKAVQDAHKEFQEAVAKQKNKELSPETVAEWNTQAHGRYDTYMDKARDFLVLSTNCGFGEPTVTFGYTQRPGTLIYDFEAKVTGGVGPYVFRWNFDDPNVADDVITPNAKIAWKYTSIKKYNVKVTVEDIITQQGNEAEGFTPSDPDSTKIDTAPAAAADCAAPSWTMVDDLPHDGNRLVAGGFEWNKDEETAKEVAERLLSEVRTDPILLAGYIRYFLGEQQKTSDMVDDNGCASSNAIEYASTQGNDGSLVKAIKAADISFASAPKKAYVTGIDGERIVRSHIEVNLKCTLDAIKISADGKVTYIRKFDGGIVTKDAPTRPVPPKKKIFTDSSSTC
ncbi:MAG TPA: hypothetical protein VF572_04060 [Candidatus Saccharimonadales bacterium]|jgi:hypothetical protein